MEITLIKDYKLNSRVLKAGTIVGVTNEKGNMLIEKGVANKTEKNESLDKLKKSIKKSSKQKK